MADDKQKASFQNRKLPTPPLKGDLWEGLPQAPKGSYATSFGKIRPGPKGSYATYKGSSPGPKGSYATYKGSSPGPKESYATYEGKISQLQDQKKVKTFYEVQITTPLGDRGNRPLKGVMQRLLAKFGPGPKGSYATYKGSSPGPKGSYATSFGKISQFRNREKVTKSFVSGANYHPLKIEAVAT